MPLQIRRGTDAERLAMTQALAQGELLYVTDTQRIYVGNGSTLGGISVTGYTNADAQDAASQIFTSGSHSGINFSYNTATNTMTATVDLSNYTGTIDAASFRGSLVADDSTLLVDAVDGKINLNGTIFGNVVPDTNIAYDLGTPSFRFRNLYVEGGGLINSSLVLGSATISASGSAINLPLGSTIGGVPIGAGGDDYFGNIVGNDSSVMINTSTYVITAAGGFVGNLTGNASSASVATTVTLVDTTTVSGTNYITFADASTGNENLRTDTDLTYNPGTNTLSCLFFSGDLTGNVTGDLTGTADVATAVTLVATNTTAGVHYLTFVDAATGDENLRTDTDLIYNPGTNTLTALSFVGNLVGDVAGNVTGDLRGSVFADDSSFLIDGTNALIVGDIANTNTNTDVFTGKTIVLSGTNGLGQKAGIRIETDGNVDDLYDLFTIEGAKSDPDSMSIVFDRSRGTLASKQPLQNGDEILGLFWFGADSNSAAQPAAAIIAGVDAAPSAGIVPGWIEISTADATGTPTPALRIDSNQIVDFAANTVAANSGTGTADVAGGVVTYLRINVGGNEYALPLYGLVP